MSVMVYPEWSPSDVDSTSKVVGSSDAQGELDSTGINTVRRWSYAIPKEIYDGGYLSKTSNAKDCFVLRRCSRLMQDYLMNYTYMVVTSFNLTQEV